MSKHASGSFEINMLPQVLVDTNAGPLMGRMSFDKTFTGDLTASSRGEMLSASTAVSGSAGYVAIERVEGTLHGRRGSFVLQHSGSMNRGTSQLSVAVVADSGTDGLLGLRGTLTIIREAGQHRYEFDYALDEDLSV